MIENLKNSNYNNVMSLNVSRRYDHMDTPQRKKIWTIHVGLKLKIVLPFPFVF